jgi:tyrosyl-tRNA synthetase
MFGKLMSISDTLMWRYYLLLTRLGEQGVAALRSRVDEGLLHPKQVKSDLARQVVTDFHGEDAAAHAAAEFERVHGRGDLPSDMREVTVPFGGEPTRALSRVLVDAGLAPSTSEAGRKIQQGGVRLGGERVSDTRARVSRSTLPLVLQAGRHAVRLVDDGELTST